LIQSRHLFFSRFFFFFSPTLPSYTAQNASITSCENRRSRPEAEVEMQYTTLLHLTGGGGHRIGAKGSCE
jgi:hypothetical protein